MCHFFTLLPPFLIFLGKNIYVPLHLPPITLWVFTVASIRPVLFSSLPHYSLPLPLSPLHQMVQSREHQLTQTENESKLDQVQSRFPNDTLYLSESLEAMEVCYSTHHTHLVNLYPAATLQVSKCVCEITGERMSMQYFHI